MAGWAAVALLALAGFAAFDNPDPTVDELETEAAAASMGHTTGAYAGLTFALLAGEPGGVARATDSADTERSRTGRRPRRLLDR